MHAYRSHTCADLRADHVGENIRLSGWVHRVRDHGGLLFIDLRDHYGIHSRSCATLTARFSRKLRKSVLNGDPHRRQRESARSEAGEPQDPNWRS